MLGVEGVKKKMNKRSHLGIVSFSSLAVGGLIYLFWRTDDLLMFQWAKYLNAYDRILEVRLMAEIYRQHFPDWVLFSLPNGLWMFSYSCLLGLIWGNKDCLNFLKWLLPVLIGFILIEAGQSVHVVPGTFDMLDVLLYIAGAIGGYFVIKPNTIKWNSYNA